MDVLIAMDAPNLLNEKAFIKHLKKEGLEYLKEEEGMVFSGKSSTPVMNTRAFILEVVKRALEKSPAKFCNMVCVIGENEMESYGFDLKTMEFKELK
ncbi:MAG: hypothetical protein GX170_05975 [Campylobacteraceae bacterium]|nr:hypothetical protein [Campylobacteraceae bacterium]